MAFPCMADVLRVLSALSTVTERLSHSSPWGLPHVQKGWNLVGLVLVCFRPARCLLTVTWALPTALQASVSLAGGGLEAGGTQDVPWHQGGDGGQRPKAVKRRG